MMSNFGKFLPALVFGLLYALATPIRHPYFNTPIFWVALAVAVLTTVWMLSEKKSGPMKPLVASIYGYIASVVAYAFVWLFQGQAGMHAYLGSFGSIEFLTNLLGMPLFSYSFILMPISVGLSTVFVRSQQKRHRAGA